MIYENDKEKQLITQLCDMALKTGGLQNKEAVDYILQNMHPLVKNNNNKSVDSKEKPDVKP